MKEFILTKQESERTVLVGIITQTQNETKANEYLDELAFLAETAGAEPVKKFLQRLEYPNPVTFVGAGKLQEIKDYVEENEIGLVISTMIFLEAIKKHRKRTASKNIRPHQSYPRYFCKKSANRQCKKSSRTGTVPISSSPIDPVMDSLGTTTRRYRNARSG